MPADFSVFLHCTASTLSRISSTTAIASVHALFQSAEGLIHENNEDTITLLTI